MNAMIERNTVFTAIPTVLLALAIVYIGLLGIISTDFGNHWDEPRLISSVQDSIKSGLLLPRWYNYPSVSYDISLLTAVSHWIMQTVHSWYVGQELKPEEFINYLAGSAFHLQLRSIFFLLSITSGIAIYILVQQLSGNAWIAIFAGLTSISTYEFIYHARWIAPDCILAMLIAWTMLSQYQILNCQNQGQRIVWIIISAILSALCIGTKYPGGIVLIPFLLAIVLSHKLKETITSTIQLAVIGLIIVAAVFIFTTPGSILEPWKFISDVRGEIAHYSYGGHGGYTVIPGLDHFSKLIVYLGTVFLSKNAILAMMSATLAIIGTNHLIKTQYKLSIWFLSLPILYILYMSNQKVMIVRNYQLLLPCFAVLMGMGLFAIILAAQNRCSNLFATAAALFVLYNLGVATESSLGIFYHSPPPPPT